MGGRFQCPKCAQQFDTKQHLRDHNLVHLSDKTLEKFQCPHCPKISNSRKSRSQHIFTAHKRRFYCKVCYARFRTQEELDEHSVKVSCVRKPRPMLSCDQCGKVLKRQLMAKHILINHTADSEKPFQCTYCPKGFAEKLTWEEHLNTHTNSKPYTCATCGWAFNSRRAMLAHEVHKHGRPKMSAGTAPAPVPQHPLPVPPHQHQPPQQAHALPLPLQATQQQQHQPPHHPQTTVSRGDSKLMSI